MTLAEILPSLRASIRPELDPAIWPVTARWGTHGDLLAGGVRMAAVAAAHGTPAHVVDEATVRARCAEYAAAFGPESVAYSAKAGLTVPLGRWIARPGLGCYVGSAAELRTALLAGFRPDRLVLHGAAKSVTDLDAAYACGAAVIAGTPREIESLSARAPSGQRVHLRVVSSAAARGRGRYGFGLGSGTALTAIETVRHSPNLVLAGLDCSIGHQLSRFRAFEACLREAMAFCAVIQARRGPVVPRLNLGGGHAVAYTGGDDGFAVHAFANRMRAMLCLAADRHGIDQPGLTVSPGRALVAGAGLTLHRVVSVRSEAGRLTVVLDGRVADCATAEGCAGRHSANLIGRVSRAPLHPATVAGGPEDDRRVVCSDLRLPADVADGDLVAVAGTGAYHHRRDDFAGRPPVLGVGDGLARSLAQAG